jgi:Phosphotransferase enzyme family
MSSPAPRSTAWGGHDAELVLDGVHGVLDLAADLVGLAFVLEVVVVGEVPGGSSYGGGMAPALGELVGQGVTSEVYAWTAETVVKLFTPRFEALAAVEYERAGAIRAAGAPCPAVHAMVEVDGRTGVVFDRLAGPSLLGERVAGSTLAHLHVELHDLPAPELPQLTDTLASWDINGMESGRSLFHGDLHPGNVLRHTDRWQVIDWSNGHLAPPAADVACSVLAIGYRGLRGAGASLDVHRRRVRAAERYLDTYRALRPAALRDLPMLLTTIGRLLLAQEPDTAFADELTSRWIDP